MPVPWGLWSLLSVCPFVVADPLRTLSMAKGCVIIGTGAAVSVAAVTPMRTSTTRIFAIAACALLVLVGCGADSAPDGSGDPTGAPTETMPADTTSPATATEPSGDDWSAPVVQGGTFSFAEARAKGPFGFWFWAPG